MKEETYRIARSLGSASHSRVIGNIDHRVIGLLPNKDGAKFADTYAVSVVAPEVQRDLLKVSDASLAEAMNYHAVNVSVRNLPCFCSFFPPFC